MCSVPSPVCEAAGGAESTLDQTGGLWGPQSAASVPDLSCDMSHNYTLPLSVTFSLLKWA